MLDAKGLKRLGRAELLELLLAQTMETERLQGELDKANAKLADREIKVTSAGNLAEAVLAVNGVMESAQAAASQYVENAQDILEQTQHKCELVLKLARESAERILSEAKTKADGIIAEAEATTAATVPQLSPDDAFLPENNEIESEITDET